MKSAQRLAKALVVSEPGAVAMGSNIQVEPMIGSLPLAVLKQRCARTTKYASIPTIILRVAGLCIANAERKSASALRHTSHVQNLGSRWLRLTRRLETHCLLD